MAATRDSAGGDAGADWDPGRLADTPLGHELAEFCRRMLGPGPSAVQACSTTLAEPFVDRIEAIERAAGECRRHDGESVALAPLRIGSLAEAVSAELSRATAALPQRQREVLALRELLRLSYAQITAVMSLEPPAIASLLARSRIRLREELRGPYPHETPPCAEREHALRLLARRLDAESLSGAEERWLLGHMADCPGCERAHAVMLEASLRYRAWVRR